MKISLKNTIFAGILCLLIPANVIGQQNSISPRNANYKIKVQLGEDQKILIGEERLSWRNISSVPTSEIYFHTYWNAFKNNKTTMAIENDGYLPGNPSEEEDYGYIIIKGFRIIDGPDLTEKIEYVSPDDGNINDKTVFRVELPGEVGPGESIDLSINFTAKIPKAMVRAGYARDFIFAAQWFPKPGVFINGQWNCHQYHRNSEFFADYGIYEVDITVPENYIVGASGELRNKVKSNGFMTYSYYEEDIHDFAWTAYPDFQEFTSAFTHPTLPEVTLTLLLQPEHENQVDRHFDAVKAAMKYLGEWFGPYPYSTLTIVDGPRDASTVNGMEYPTLITAGTDWIAPEKYHSPEAVTVHEFIHQYFYGLVGNNEFEDAWLDEGITSYLEVKIMQEYYGDDVQLLNIGGIPFYGEPLLEFKGFPIVAHWNELPVNSNTWLMQYYLENRSSDPIAVKSWEVRDGSAYTNTAYAKPALMLFTLENIIGEDKMRLVMKRYFDKWKFGHPETGDFINNFNSETGKDWSWFFDQVLFGTGVIDYAVKEIKNEPPVTGQGIFDAEFIDVRTVSDEGIINSEVTIVRNGEVIIPVEVKIRFENGEVFTETWDGSERWKKYKFKTDSKVISAQVDPDNKILLDINITNNSMKAESSRKGAVRWTNKWLFWMQNLLQIMSYII